MITPKVLVLGKFEPNDLTISISESNRKIDQVVEGQLEELWQQKMKHAKEQGKNIYNGLSYRLNSFEQRDQKLMLDLGIFEYKVRDGLIEAVGYYDLDESFYRKGCFTGATVKTADNKYLMVELSGKSMNMNVIDQLGGIVETVPEIKTGEDLFASLYRELEEEALISKDDIIDSYLRAMYLERRTNIGFYLEVALNVSSAELLNRFIIQTKDQDIKSLKVFTREEYIDTLKSHNENKQLIADLLLI